MQWIRRATTERDRDVVATRHTIDAVAPTAERAPLEAGELGHEPRHVQPFHTSEVQHACAERESTGPAIPPAGSTHQTFFATRNYAMPSRSSWRGLLVIW